jgi:hypothetical protein
MEPMRTVDRGLRRAQSSRSRSATKVSQRTYLRSPLGSPRRQIAEPRSSTYQCRGEWNVPKSGFLVPVQPNPDCSLRWVFATRWERLGARIGLAARIVDAIPGALGKSCFRSGASPHQRIGLATEIASTTRAALVKFRFHSGATRLSSPKSSPHHFWRPYRARSLERTYPGLKPRAESWHPFGVNLPL